MRVLSVLCDFCLHFRTKSSLLYILQVLRQKDQNDLFGLLCDNSLYMDRHEMYSSIDPRSRLIIIPKSSPEDDPVPSKVKQLWVSLKTLSGNLDTYNVVIVNLSSPIAPPLYVFDCFWRVWKSDKWFHQRNPFQLF